MGRHLPRRWASSSKGEEFNEPGGLLFGEPPLKPGEKRKWAEWEYIWYPTLFSAAVILGFGLTSRPEGSSIHEWAKKEALEREERVIARIRARDAAEKEAEMARVAAAMEADVVEVDVMEIVPTSLAVADVVVDVASSE